jgi:dipeptidyl aminopeptidase/acylaminoacyl peptidase
MERSFSAFVWMPFILKRDGSNPAIVLPHGGPTGQVVDYFYALAAALSSRGYICIAPNVRGSTGYGMEFQKANHQGLGGGDLQDEVYATFCSTRVMSMPRQSESQAARTVDS